MSWNRQRAIERIEKAEKNIPQIEISRLERKMNLDNVTLSKPKIIEGAHLYSAVTNEADCVTGNFNEGDREAAKVPLRAVHLWQREISDVVCKDFDAAKIHFQGTRLHAFIYRPVGDAEQLAVRTVALAFAVQTTTRLINEIHGNDVNFKLAAGASFGDTLATRSGSRGDSELLFVGDAANHGAKAIKSGVSLRVTQDLADLLPTDMEGLTVTEPDGAYQKVTLTHAALVEVVERYGLSWSEPVARKRIQNRLDATPLDKVSVSKATIAIDKDALSLANSKLNDAVSLFGDLDGFTKMVEEATTDTARQNLIRRFHHIRSELRHVCTRDFDTLRIQYQGDRIQALRHLPGDDEAKRALQAVRLAAAWQSTMEDTLPAVLGDLGGARLAVGLDVGATAISKLGEHGNRDVICLGKATRRAAKVQGKLDGDEVGLSKHLYDLLPARVQDLFSWDSGKNCYVAEGLRYNTVIDAEEADKLDQQQSIAKRFNPALAGSTAHYAPRHRHYR